MLSSDSIQHTYLRPLNRISFPSLVTHPSFRTVSETESLSVPHGSDDQGKHVFIVSEGRSLTLQFVNFVFQALLLELSPLFI